MLLRFSAANYRSIRDPQTLSLVASALKDNEAGLLGGSSGRADRVLPAAVVYGANASGKSNLVDALHFMRQAVLDSHRHGDPAGGVPRSPFLLEKEYVERPTTLDIDFVIDRVRYHYGFEVNDQAFLAEWLFAFPNERRQVLFTRKRQRFEFGRGLRGRNKVIEDLTRPNSLFVSAAAQNDHEQLSIISRFFNSTHAQEDLPIRNPSPNAAEKLDERVISFLVAIGTGVVSYRRKEVEMPQKTFELTKRIMTAMNEVLGSEPSKLPETLSSKIFQVELGHKAKDGSVVYLDVDSESAGTRRLLAILSGVFRALDDGTIIIIDELDESLHTLACEAVLSLFSTPKSNPKAAQLIATTHDTNLLCSRFLRRDQVWFTEKDSNGATCLFPLTEIRTRKGDNIEKGYLQGRYGAIPFAGSVADLLAGK